MKKHLILTTLLLTILLALLSLAFTRGVYAQETNAEGQTYEQWQAENDRINALNKEIEQKNKEIEEQNKKSTDEYNKRVEDSNKSNQAYQDALARIRDRRLTPQPTPRPTSRPRPTATPTATPTPTPNPVNTVMIYSQSETTDDTVKQTEAATIEFINKSFADKKISVKKDRTDMITLTSEDVSVEIAFPVIMNTDTKVIQVIMPSGMKTLSILPNRALENAKQKSGLSEVTGTVRLEEANRQPVYIVTGKKTVKILWIFSWEQKVEAMISIENGEIADSSQK